MTVEPARTVGAVDVEPTLTWGTVTIPQDALWGVISGIAVTVPLVLLAPGLTLKALCPIVGMVQILISLWRQEGVGGWKLLGAKFMSGRLPNKVEGRARSRERMQVLPDGTRKIEWSRPQKEDERLRIASAVEPLADGLIRSPDRGHMVVLRYEVPGEHWGSDNHERWARRFVGTLQEIGGSAQLWTRIHRLEGESLRSQQAQAIADTIQRIGTQAPADVVEAELAHAEKLASRVHIVEHYLVLHPEREGLWIARWQAPLQSSREEAETMMEKVLLDHGSALRARPATVEEIRAAVAWGVNGGQIAYADYRTGMVSMPEGERRMIALKRPPRELYPGKLMEACLNLDVDALVVTTRLAPVPEYEAVQKLKKVARDYENSLTSQKSGAEERATKAAIQDADQMAEQIFQERSSSWRWQTLVEFSAAPGKSQTVMRSLLTELQEARWKPQPIRLWPLHSHAAASLGGGALKRFELLMPGRGVAYALPVMGMPFSDSHAPIFGRNELTGTPVFLDVTKEYGGGAGTQTNRNMCLIGPPGSGKTTTLGELLAAVAIRGGGLTVLDYHSEMASLIVAYGGRYIELADTALNPFAGVVPGISSEQKELLRETISILGGGYLNNDRRGLHEEEESWLTEALNWFVTAWLEEGHSLPPVLSDFLLRVERERHREGSELPVIDERAVSNLLLRLRIWTQGLKGQTFNRHTTLDLSESRLICLGMRKLRESLSTENLYGPIAIVLSAFHRELTKYGPNIGWIRNRGYTMHLVVDEAHLAFDDPTLGPALVRFSKETRKYGGGVLAASQNLEDWMGGRNSQRFLENAGTKLFLGTTQQTRDSIRHLAGVEDWELDFLVERNDRGFGILIAGQEKAIVRITPHELILSRLQEVMD